MAGRRSKLQCYIDTVEALSSGGPMPMSRLSLKTKINCSPLKAILSDLLWNNLVEERRTKNRTFYVATSKARTVLSLFNQLNQIIPLV